MVKKELMKIGVSSGIGILIMLLMIFENKTTWPTFITPFYIVGICYGGKELLKALFSLTNNYFKLQIVSLIISPFRGTIISIIVLFAGLGIIISIGWLFGIVKCIGCLTEAYKVDGEVIKKEDY